MRLQSLCVAAAVFGAPVCGWAAFVTPTNWTRPADAASATATLTTYQEWNVFTSPGGPNAPDVANINPNSIAPNLANIADSSGASFVTSGGNIYSPTAPIIIEAQVPQYGLTGDFATSVVFQVRTLGSELNYDGVRLNYNDGTGDQSIAALSRQELSRVALGGFGGSRVETLFVFDVPAAPSSFRFAFQAAEDSVSLDSVAIDTQTVAVPEPASVGLLAMVGAALLRRRRN